ncbi:hypothetical protein PAESOLCIP111_01777 [Paenibacillus solanacearum]|uniref:DUF1868 domain-containing protein n=1 Tax=Paenibacillus solanacearum TaxID=2048548 RepID=A0A916K1L0_9BACL|nr:2'-5' RNA ligase family protein [Paenibacillus solanacearum]CAG7615078.1 hypothetical protein PAESOLCIP111_01777 [Paenibacillus solanacearum]
MFRVTNRKINGFRPVWAHFNGFSLLFDNPGDSYAPAGGSPELEQMFCREEEADTSFYSSLWETANGLERMARDYLFCFLPLHSYHVTVWDAINDFNVHKLPDPIRQEAEALLAGLPNSRCKESRLLPVMCADSGWFGSGSLAFEFDRLENWNNNGVVATLKPADSESAAILNNIKTERVKLNRFVEERFGFATATETYRPHVSVGYFANKEQGAQSAETVEQLNLMLAKELKDRKIVYSSISLYGMTDMETFIRKRPM